MGAQTYFGEPMDFQKSQPRSFSSELSPRSSDSVELPEILVAEKTMVYGRYNERWWENKPTNITGEHHPVYCLYMGISWKYHGNMMRLNIVQNRSLMGFIWRCPFCHGGIPKSSSHHG
jgi:hypothetical protein